MDNQLADARTTVKQETSRIDKVDAATNDIKMTIIEVENRLRLAVERLDGEKPREEPTSVEQLDQPGSFGSIESKQTDSRKYLEHIIGWLNELEHLV